MILSMDETMCELKKKLKMLVGDGTRKPLTVQPEKIPHLTGVITIRAYGEYL